MTTSIFPFTSIKLCIHIIIVLFFHLCFLLIHNFQRSIPISANPCLLQAMKKSDDFPPMQEVVNAYLLYIGLLETENEFCCIKCGFYPPILEMDACRNTSIDMPSKFYFLDSCFQTYTVNSVMILCILSYLQLIMAQWSKCFPEMKMECDVLSCGCWCHIERLKNGHTFLFYGWQIFGP